MGWTSLGVKAVSANGRIIVGTGLKAGAPQAFLIELPVPGDWNADGFADGADVLLWQRGLGSTYNAADLNDWRVDFTTVAAMDGQASPQLGAVPEPSAAILGVIVAVGLRARRRIVVEPGQH